MEWTFGDQVQQASDTWLYCEHTSMLCPCTGLLVFLQHMLSLWFTQSGVLHMLFRYICCATSSIIDSYEVDDVTWSQKQQEVGVPLWISPKVVCAAVLCAEQSGLASVHVDIPEEEMHEGCLNASPAYKPA